MTGGRVVVTGGASGIGRAVAIRLHRQGCAVHVMDRQAPVLTLPDDVVVHRVDVTDTTELVGTLSRIGSVQAVAACAGVKEKAGTADTEEDSWDRIHSVNLRSVFVLVRHVLPAMQRAGSGAIVTVGSPSGYGDPASSAYAAAKAGVVGFSKSVALEMAGTGVRINTVVPGFTRTGMTQGADGQMVRSRGRTTASGTVNDPDDVAAVVAFLLSAEARNVSGAVVEVGRTHGEPALGWIPSERAPQEEKR